MQIHLILVFKLKMGMRFDEILTFSIELVSNTSDEAPLTLVESIKKSIV